MRKKPLVIVTRKLPDGVETRMRELFDTRLNETDEPLSQAALGEAMKAADVLVPTVTDRIDAALIEQAGEQLKLIANFGNGVDNIDVEAALRRGIAVTNTPGVLTDDTADMTLALILAVSRRIVEGANTLAAGEWTGWSPTWMLGTRITGKRLGIVGMGRIGQAVARRAKAFGLSIHYHNRRRAPTAIEDELEMTYWESLDQMLARMDIVSVNCPHTPATYHLLSARRLKLLRPNAIVVNTARGEVIDENELGRLIEAGAIAGAGLDVFEHEPAINPKLLASDRVVALPHMSSATIEGRVDMGEKVIICLGCERADDLAKAGVVHQLGRLTPGAPAGFARALFRPGPALVFHLERKHLDHAAPYRAVALALVVVKGASGPGRDVALHSGFLKSLAARRLEVLAALHGPAFWNDPAASVER